MSESPPVILTPPGDPLASTNSYDPNSKGGKPSEENPTIIRTHTPLEEDATSSGKIQEPLLQSSMLLTADALSKVGSPSSNNNDAGDYHQDQQQSGRRRRSLSGVTVETLSAIGGLSAASAYTVGSISRGTALTNAAAGVKTFLKPSTTQSSIAGEATSSISSPSSSHMVKIGGISYAGSADPKLSASMLEDVQSISNYINELKLKAEKSARLKQTSDKKLDLATEDSIIAQSREYLSKQEGYCWRYTAEMQEIHSNCYTMLAQLFARNAMVEMAKKRHFQVSGERERMQQTIKDLEGNVGLLESKLKVSEEACTKLRVQVKKQQLEMEQLKRGLGVYDIEKQRELVSSQIPRRDAIIADLMEKNSLLTAALAGDSESMTKLSAIEEQKGRSVSQRRSNKNNSPLRSSPTVFGAGPPGLSSEDEDGTLKQDLSPSDDQLTKEHTISQFKWDDDGHPPVGPTDDAVGRRLSMSQDEASALADLNLLDEYSKLSPILRRPINPLLQHGAAISSSRKKPPGNSSSGKSPSKRKIAISPFRTNKSAHLNPDEDNTSEWWKTGPVVGDLRLVDFGGDFTPSDQRGITAFQSGNDPREYMVAQLDVEESGDASGNHDTFLASQLDGSRKPSNLNRPHSFSEKMFTAAADARAIAVSSPQQSLNTSSDTFGDRSGGSKVPTGRRPKMAPKRATTPTGPWH